MTTLTDRYVDATLRSLPERQRPDIEKELRASIADAVDGRLDAGGDPADAEIAVLTELGDPARLAAGYADRSLYLIGPRLYFDYLRLLKVLLVTIVPAVAAITGLVRILDDATAADLIADAFGAALTAALHIACWTTLAFALLERSPARRGIPIRPWTPADLPEPPSRRMRYSELVLETVALVLFTTLILLSPVLSPKTDANGDPISVLSPWLWDTGVVWVFIALVVLSLGFSFAKYYARWSVPLAIAATLVNWASPIMLIWLASNDHLINPAFATAAGWDPTVLQWVGVGVSVGAIFTMLHSVYEGIAQARRR